MVGLAIATGLRRGELLALRWKDADRECAHVREAVYDGTFGTPKTEAGCRQVPLSAAALQLLAAWKVRAPRADSEALVFATQRGTPLSHDKGVPGKVVAQLMGHANVDTTLNVYTQVLDESMRAAVETVGQELFTIVQSPGETAPLIHRQDWCAQQDSNLRPPGS